MGWTPWSESIIVVERGRLGLPPQYRPGTVSWCKARTDARLRDCLLMFALRSRAAGEVQPDGRATVQLRALCNKLRSGGHRSTWCKMSEDRLGGSSLDGARQVRRHCVKQRVRLADLTKHLSCD